MQVTKFIIPLLSGLLLGGSLAVSQPAVAVEQGPAAGQSAKAELPGESYQASGDAVADLAASLESARQSNKLALVVLGGNWCHDSRALAARLFEEPLRTIIDEYYETLFVDVGYLDKGQDVIGSLGIPVYYATPTVLIVDPVSRQVLNETDQHRWAEAASIGMKESVNYFKHYAGADLTALRNSDETDTYLQELLAQIDTFEQQQADRLYRAYTMLGPKLKAYKEGDKGAFSDELWNEVRDYRYQVPLDLEALRTEARERVAAGETGITLDYPEYVAFSWE